MCLSGRWSHSISALMHVVRSVLGAQVVEKRDSLKTAQARSEAMVFRLVAISSNKVGFSEETVVDVGFPQTLTQNSS